METPQLTPPQSQVLKDDLPTDSGYRSPPGSPSALSAHAAGPTTNSSASTMPSQQSRAVSKSASLPSHTIHGMHVFQRTVSKEMQSRFEDVMERLSGPLATYLRRSRHEHRPTAIRLMFLGHEESSARPWIIVLCPELVKKRAEKFFKQDMAERLCQSDEPGRESFQVVVVGQAPRPRADEYVSRVGTPSGLSTADENTSHSFQSSSDVNTKHDGISSSAAIGGYILVTNFDRTETTYGLTAGHVLPQTAIDSPLSDGQWDGSMPSPDSSDSEDDLTSIPEYSAKGRGRSLLEGFIGPRGEPAWTGMVLAEATFSREARDRDWALIERIRANEVASLYTETRHRLVVLGTVEDLQPAQIRFDEEHVLNCTISWNTSMLLTPSGHNFVQAHMLTLDASESIQDGASGTWVTSRWTRGLDRRISGSSEPILAYGQVVADDIFGDVYMIPLSDIIDDIMVLTRAAAITLPESLMELEHILPKKRGREEVDQVGSEEASSVPETHTSTHDKVSRMKGRSVTNEVIDYSHILDSDVPTHFSDAIDHYNALQSESSWRNLVASTNHSEGDDNAEEEDEAAHGDVDDVGEENDDDSTSDVGHGAPETKIEPWWTSDEDRRLKKMRSDRFSWSRIMEEFPNRAERKVKEHWFKDLCDGARGEKPSSTSTRATQDG